jgi:hypothetical protein
MKTLKQLIQIKKDEISKQYNGLQDELTPDEVIECTKIWITQNKQTRTATNVYANIGYQQALIDLLEELE